MRLLSRSKAGKFILTNDLVGDDPIPPYAILSHTWLADTEEPTFEDLTNGTGEKKLGYKKIRFCGEQARQNGLQYFWVDTCCINKANSAELSQAINSMFRWYRNATRCCVYLSDVPSPPCNTNDEFNPRPWESDFRKSKWFTRGWTLQELLASRSVEFFSREGKRLSDRSSLKQQIHEITRIPASALQGASLSRFPVNDLFSWMEGRQTKLAEDKVYSLLGIFDVKIPLFYGEGAANAFKRLQKVINKREKCMQDLCLTDPRDDKKRIEDTNGGLLEDSYRWILENPDFQQWYRARKSRLLWVKGNPGKGKTMLLGGIINELKKLTAETHLLSFFYCQAADSRINNATAVLRGLLYLLINQQPSLISHIQNRYDHAGKTLFENIYAWVALSEIFENILQDPNLNYTYLIIDALDECTVDLPKLLKFIVQKSSISSRVKWLVSSRNWPSIEEQLEKAGIKVKLCLELNAESVSAAVSSYIRHKVHQLAQEKRYDDKTRDAVLDYMFLNANNTFLWVALVCQNLQEVKRRNVLAKLNDFPPGLDSLYGRMIEQVDNSNDADLCKRILACLAVVYRPIVLKEMTALVGGLRDMPDNELAEIINLCGSFLTLREGTIHFVHQSAKDFLLTKASGDIFPLSLGQEHHSIFSRSLSVMHKVLRRDVYGLAAPGYPIDKVQTPDPDPLAAARYSCVYWIDHLCDWHSGDGTKRPSDLENIGIINNFLGQCYLYWLETLSLLKSMSQGALSMAKLEDVLQVRFDQEYYFLSRCAKFDIENDRDIPVDGPCSGCTPISSVS
jgi:hypothetical protein